MSAAAPGRSSTALQVVAGHDLAGMETIVTGGASGLGYETSRALASAGARVVVAGRDQARGEQAVRALREDTGNNKIVFRPLDLASLESVTTWARKHSGTGKPCHILVLNAGVMAPPLTRTAGGFELQLGVNYLAHFAFTLGLLPSLRAAGTARVVSVSSSAHRRSDIDFDDPNYLHRPYDPWQGYGDPVGLFGDSPGSLPHADLEYVHDLCCGRPLPPSPFPAAESGRHVYAAEAVAGGAGRYGQGREERVPEGGAGDPRPRSAGQLV